MSNRGWVAALNRGWVVRGRRWSIRCSRRTAERRAVSWAGIGPARGHATTTTGEPVGAGKLVGVALHAGPLLIVALSTPRPPLRAVPAQPFHGGLVPDWVADDLEREAKRAGLM